MLLALQKKVQIFQKNIVQQEEEQHYMLH